MYKRQHQKKKYIENIFRDRSEIYGLKKSNDSDMIRRKLIKIKGIGDWTVDMFLIFSKRDLDIFPEGDLALVNVIKELYNVESMEKIREIARKWAPFKTIATLYLWDSLDDDFPS